MRLKYATKLRFSATNNIAIYEALLIAQRILKELWVTHVTINSDAYLVLNQCQGSYQIKDPNLSKYGVQVKSFMSELQMKGNEFSIMKIPSSENEEANSLTKLASVGEQHITYILPFK